MARMIDIRTMENIVKKKRKEAYHFEVSLSVLNHLGRNLYRSFLTVLGEAISNAWDADATEVRIFIDEDKTAMTIVDNGEGITTEDFQDKFFQFFTV